MEIYCDFGDFSAYLLIKCMKKHLFKATKTINALTTIQGELHVRFSEAL